MQTYFTSVKNPRWVNAEQTMIDCDITTSKFGNEVLPFTASSNDPEEHGRAVFADLVSGVYGEIAAFVPPPEPEPIAQNTATSSSGEIPGSVL